MNQNWILKHSLLLLILPFIGCVKREQTFDFEKQYLLALDGERIVVDGKPFSGTLFQPWVIDNDTLEKIRYEIDLYKGVPHGKLKMYYSDGILSLSAAYKNGNLDGPYEEYIEDGQLSIVGSFNEGQQNGVWTFYDNEGNIEFQGTFNNGLLGLSVEQKFFHIITQAIQADPENRHRETDAYIQGFLVYGMSLFNYNTGSDNSTFQNISSISFKVAVHDFSGDYIEMSSIGSVTELREQDTCGYRDCSNLYDYSITGRWIDEQAGDGTILLSFSKEGRIHVRIIGDGDWWYSEVIKVSEIVRFLNLNTYYSKKYLLNTKTLLKSQTIERGKAEKQGPTPCGSSIEDVDGNTYKTVQIGTQCWMAENLKTSKYQDGTPIPNVTSNTLWSNLTTGAWAHHDNQTAKQANHGKLYNWYAAADQRNVCPVGWIVPKDADWTVLSNHLGSEPGQKMKSTSG